MSSDDSGYQSFKAGTNDAPRQQQQRRLRTRAERGAARTTAAGQAPSVVAPVAEGENLTDLILGMLNGAMNYGVRNSTTLTPVLGMYRWADVGVPEPAPQFIPLLVHEVAHSYANPIVDEHWKELRDVATRIF